MGKVTGTGFPQRKVLYSQMTRDLITLVFFEFLIHGLLDALLECGVGGGGRGFPGGSGNTIQETQYCFLVQEDPICRGAAKPMRHNYKPSTRATTLEPMSRNY